MKKILLLETEAFNGGSKGGSYIQANYYLNLLQKKGYDAELFRGVEEEGKFDRIKRVLSSSRKSHIIIGFGTPILGIYLQWLAFIFNKKGIYCVDTIIVPLALIKDYLKRRIFSYKTIIIYLIRGVVRKMIRKLPPPKQNLINIPACYYVKEKMKNYSLKIYKDGYLFPRVDLNHVKKPRTKEKIVLYYGALFRGRGVLDLLKGCRILWEKGYSFNLHIYGWQVDPLTKITLTQMLKKEKYLNNIIVREKIDNIRSEVLKASMVVLPFRYPCSFAVPYTLIEPMAWGIPVITTNAGSFPQWVKDGETGFIVRKEDPKDIADKIERLLTDEKVASKLAGNAENLVRERFKKEDVLLKVLKSIN